MGSLKPPPASFLLPPLTPAMDTWFISSASDHLFTQALTRELHSTSSASSSSSSGRFVDHVSPSFEHSNKYSDSLHLQSQSNLSQVPGSPLSSDSVCKEQPESPFTNGNSVFGMSTPAMVNLSSFTESYLPHHQSHAPQKGCTKAIQAPSSALSSQAAAGAGASKVSKRRSRSNKKPPIAVLSTDTSNFRAMVQQLTGIPTPQPLPHLWGTSGVPLLKPQPTRLSPVDLTTLDTSMSFLAPKINPFLQSHNGFLGSSYYSNIINYDALLSSSSISMGTNGNCTTGVFSTANSVKEGGQSVSVGPLSASIENFLMNDDNTIDSWLAFDGGAMANHSPKVDLTKIAS